MTEPRRLGLAEVIAAHDKQLARFGGPPGIPDQSALESAIGRPINKLQYEQAELAECAAACAFGPSRNQAFVDGNKRAAFVSKVLFRRLICIGFKPDKAEALVKMQDLAAGLIVEAGMTRWIRDSCRGAPPRTR